MVKNVAFLALTILIACGAPASEESEVEVKGFELDEGQDPILAPYFEIVKALQNDQFDKAREVGRVLAAAEQDTGVKLALTRMGTLMNQASSTFDQRDILKQMGMVMTLYIEQDIINEVPIYKFKCVNEFDGKEVVWFGLSKHTTNPFIGENSNECIELVETIKPIIKK